MKHLIGKRILLTRTAAQNKDTAALLISQGAVPISLPCTSIEPLAQSIQHALTELKTHSSTDIIFSSRNGVQAVVNSGHDAQAILRKHRVIAVGEKTANTLQQYDIQAAWLPKEASQQGLIADYPSHGLPKQAIFFRAEIGSDKLLNFLQQQGVYTQLVPCYRVVMDTHDASHVIQQLQTQNVDAVLLGSARTAEFYVQKVGNTQLANYPAIAVISPQVRKAADKLGLQVQVTAKAPSFVAMLRGLNDYFATQGKG